MTVTHERYLSRLSVGILLVGCLPADRPSDPFPMAAVTDTFQVHFRTDTGRMDRGQVVTEIQLRTLGQTPVVTYTWSWRGGPSGDRREHGVQRFPDLMPLHDSIQSRHEDLAIHHAVDYLQITGYNQFGPQTRLVPRTEDVRSVQNIELWLRATSLAQQADTVVMVYDMWGRAVPMRLRIEGRMEVATPVGVRRAWLIHGTLGEHWPIERRWWIDATTRRVLRHTVTSESGVWEFALP